TALDRDRVRSLTRNRRQPPELIRAEILDHDRIRSGLDRLSHIVLTRDLHRHLMQVTELLFRTLHCARDATENRNMIRRHYHAVVQTKPAVVSAAKLDR